MNNSDYKSKILGELKKVEGEPNAGSMEMLELARDEKKVSKLIQLLNDEEHSAQDKQDALNTLSAINVFSQVLDKKMPEYVNALRGLMDSKNANLRQKAFGNLAIMKDEVAQQRLLDDMKQDKNENDKLVPTHQAIAMLGFDEKALDLSILKRIIQNPPDKESLIEAVRHLPGNEESFEMLKKVMEDDSKPIEVRSMIPDLISNANPIAFLESAQKILIEKGLKHDLIPFLASGIAGIQKKGVTSEVEATKNMFRKLKGPQDIKEVVNQILFNSRTTDKENF